MKTSKVILCSVSLIFVLWQELLAQTQDIQNQKTYWEYRDRFKKFFTKIGKQPGESIPIASIVYNFDNGEFTCIDPDSGFSATIHYTDATAFLGDYIGMLATEYKLLKNNNQDVQPTLNELYYALNAVDRVDLEAEHYYGLHDCWNTNQGGNQNGYFIRDDVPAEITDNWKGKWNNTPPVERDPRDNVKAMQGDYIISHPQYTCDPYNSSYCDKKNEESQDQLMYLLQGMALVKKMFVDDVFVKPTTADAGFYIKAEAVNIATRLTNYVFAEQDFSIPFDPLVASIPAMPLFLPALIPLAFNFDPIAYAATLTLPTILLLTTDDDLDFYGATYCITNPVGGGLVHAGGLMQPFA